MSRKKPQKTEPVALTDPSGLLVGDLTPAKETTPPPQKPCLPSCGACRWWYNKDEHLGECRRFPPAVIDTSKLTPFGPVLRWGLTSEDTSCGEFCPR